MCLGVVLLSGIMVVARLLILKYARRASASSRWEGETLDLFICSCLRSYGEIIGLLFCVPPPGTCLLPIGTMVVALILTLQFAKRASVSSRW